MHQDVVARFKPSHLIPGENPVFGHNPAVVHHHLMMRALFLIDKIRQEHVHGMLLFPQRPQGIKNFQISFFVYPVVAVHHFKIQSRGMGQPRIDRAAVSGVGLVDGPDDVRVSGGVGIRNFAGIILRGAVVHNQNFHFIPADEQRVDTAGHIIGRVVAGDGYGQ